MDYARVVPNSILKGGAVYLACMKGENRTISMITHQAPYSITGLNPYTWIRWWYKLAAPKAPPDAEALPLREREFLRRGKLTSIALLIELIEMFIAIGAGIQDPNKGLLPILFTIIGVLIIAAILNRFRKLTTAGIVTIVVVEVGMIGNILGGAVNGHLGTFQLPLLCLLAQPLMISVLLFPAWGGPIVGMFNVLAIISFLRFMPKTPDLQFYLNTQPYLVYSIPITIQVVIALISFIVITSLQESMIRADRAEEIAKLQQIMAEQARREVDEKHLQDAWFEQVVTTMTHLANGDRAAKIPSNMEIDATFGPVSRSLNNMLGRYVRLRDELRPLDLTMQAVQMHLQALRTAQINHTAPHLQLTGTPADQLVEAALRLNGTILQPPQPLSMQDSRQRGERPLS